MEQNIDINSIAMDVILNAGNGRAKIDKALDSMTDFDFQSAGDYLQQAESDVLKAHVSQTKVIQNQVGGNDTEYSLLFIHAQDTLMTINTELRLTMKLMGLLKAVYEKIN